MQTQIIYGILIPFIGTTAGAACVFFLRRQPHFLVQRSLTGFAAGVMTAASVWSLLIPAMEQSEGRERLPGRRPSRLRGAVLAAVMGYPAERSVHASAVHLVVLAPDTRQDRVPKGHGVHKCAGDIRRSLPREEPPAGFRVPDRLHKRTYEREHDNLVRDNADFHRQERTFRGITAI